MALARYSPDLNLTQAYRADANILANAVVVGGTVTGHCTTPSVAAVRSGVLGVASNAIASGADGDVHRGGIVRFNAAGTIALYDPLVVAGVTGTVKKLELGDLVGATVIGYALESAVSGDVFAAYLEISQAPNGIIERYTVGTGGCTINCAVIMSTATDRYVVLPAGAAITTAPPLGIAQSTEIAGATVLVVKKGLTLGLDSGSGWTRGQMLDIAAAAGTFRTATAAGGTNTGVIGVAAESATASQSKMIDVGPFMLQA